MKRRASALWPILLVACGREPVPQPEAAATDSAATAPTLPAPTFDPGGVEAGDTVGGLAVVSKAVERAGADSVWVGNVVFEGDLVVQGVYQQHPDWPSVQAPCFHVTDPASAARIPRFAPDSWTQVDARSWFCFSNPDVALDVLGSPDEPREMVIALSRYQLWRELSDVNDMAELSELLQVGAATRRTLVDPI